MSGMKIDRFPDIIWYTVPKIIDFPQYNMKFSGGNEILRGIFRFPLHFMLYHGNLEYFLESIGTSTITIPYLW